MRKNSKSIARDRQYKMNVRKFKQDSKDKWRDFKLKKMQMKNDYTIKANELANDLAKTRIKADTIRATGGATAKNVMAAGGTGVMYKTAGNAVSNANSLITAGSGSPDPNKTDKKPEDEKDNYYGDMRY